MTVAQRSTTTLRILAVDDEEPILQSYRQILDSSGKTNPSSDSLNDLAAELFGSATAEELPEFFPIELVCCNQSQQALELIRQAQERQESFAVVFLDMRMPPGNDGIWLAENIRRLDPAMQIVVVTGYSDTAPSQIRRRVPPADKLFYLQKPFHHHELHQFAIALGTKWLADSALRQYQQNLENLVTQRTRELETALAQAQAASVAKSQFLANMSHEIRTPMNAIIGFTDVLLEEPLSGPHRQYVEAISTAGHNLLSVINDILDFSKIEAGKMEVRIVPASLRDILNAVQTVIEPLAMDKKLSLQVAVQPGVPETIPTDPQRLQQCLINLLGNAVKFTAKGQIFLRVLRDRRENQDWLSFQVEDTGVGIAPDKLAMVFEAFMQADNSHSRQYGGTGLGLTITKRLVELLNGTLSVNSTPGVGSVFTICLPMA
jgi:signal transduction histidine kinase